MTLSVPPEDQFFSIAQEHATRRIVSLGGEAGHQTPVLETFKLIAIDWLKLFFMEDAAGTLFLKGSLNAIKQKYLFMRSMYIYSTAGLDPR